jgi:large subunit ribosomal protein L4
MEVKVLNIQGQDTGRTIELKDSIFNLEQPNDHAIYLDVKAILANRRQGTHKAKERSEITGSTRKLYRQKGTGNARRGDIKSPLLRGGGRVFGPRPRDYFQKVNRKLKLLARKSALTYKMRDGEIIVVEDFTFDEPKTKKMVEIRNNLNLPEKKSLFVLNSNDKNVYLSARNLKNTDVIEVYKLNTYSILRYKNLVFTESSINYINENYDK